LDTESAPGVFPLNGAIDTGDLTGAAFQATGKLDYYLSLLIKSIEVRWASIDTKVFLTVLTDFLVKRDMGFFVVFKSIEGQFLCDLHQASN
jgi:hypothetical protein